MGPLGIDLGTLFQNKDNPAGRMSVLPAGYSTAKKELFLPENRHRFVTEPEPFGVLARSVFFPPHAAVIS
jgi:hypothetical protein